MATETSVGTSLTTIAELDSRYAEFMGFAIVNGSTALNAFQVQAQATPDAPWITIKSASFTDGAEFTPAWATADLATLGSEVAAYLLVLGKHWRNIRLRASVASGTSDVTVYSVAGA